MEQDNLRSSGAGYLRASNDQMSSTDIRKSA
jgi:hypothetical protein